VSDLSTPALTWDIFCHVIDNWGDLGVCWRLSAQLAQAGHHVRLWADDPTPLDWMAPGARQGQWPGISVHPWARTDLQAPPPAVPPGQVLIESFGCEIAPLWVERLLPQGVWINLEYLSAESYVERSHCLPSPVMSGPLAGCTKWFFFPGFTERTGGLLREWNLQDRQHAFDATGWRAARGIGAGTPLVTLFSYEPRPLAQLVQAPELRHAHWLVAPGRACAAMDQVWSPSLVSTRTDVPHLPQADFDHGLWASDLNLVRGEDSLVRALWAAQAFVWHIYPQQDNAHHDKLDAFLDWLDAPDSLRRFHRIWNGVENGPLPALDLQGWRECARAAREKLLAQDDLLTQLLRFVKEKQ